MGSAVRAGVAASCKLLDGIDGAEDVRRLPRSSLPKLCSEIRDCLIDTVSRTAGHFASGLGVVELTTALHYVYDTPHDVIVWDVGHQAYPHKILTGHRKELSSIRQPGGLHAFIWRGETKYDLLSTGHASTSIGSALGIAVAQRYKPAAERRRVVAVIGDGAMSGGCAFEALNHAGSFKDIDLTVILNDNEWSISENVGSLAQSLAHIISSPHYVKLIEGGKRILDGLPAVRDLALRAQEHVKGMLMPGTLFEEFGFNYIGPVDGHDVDRLVSILQNVRGMSGLNFVHVVTTKGKGYAPAEKDPICYHGVPKFDPDTGIQDADGEDLSYSAAFGRWMCDRAQSDRRLVGITPAMRVGSGLVDFAKRFPHRFFDVAIAEQHAMVFASGLAADGMRPVVSIYSSFMQRAYDGLIHDMAVQDLPIILALDRGGVVGPDGPTHNGSFDIAFTRTVPNLMIAAPSSRRELYFMLNTAYAYGRPAVVRYPRAIGESIEAHGAVRDGERRKILSLDETVDIGSVECLVEASFDPALKDPEAQRRLGIDVRTPSLLSDGAEAEFDSLLEECDRERLKRIKESKARIALMCFGPVAHELKALASSLDCTLFNMRFIKPLNEEAVRHAAMNYDLLFCAEEGASMGGAGEEIAAVAAALPRGSLRARVLHAGLPDRFMMEAPRERLLQEAGLDPLSVLRSLHDAVAK